MKAKRILVFIGMLLTFYVFGQSSLSAQSCLRGRVRFSYHDDKGQHLIGASNTPLADIYANDLQVGTSIDSLGYFHICDIPRGEHVFTVSSIGFETVRFTLRTLSDTSVEIVLPQRILETAELTVTGITRAGDMKTNAQALQIVGARVWERNNSQGLVQVLATQPGVSAISTGAAIAKPVIRGLGYNRIVTVSDGVRQEGQQWGDEHGIEVDDFGIAKVEVLKGPGSLMYGSDAIAGVINIIDPLPDRKQLIRGKVMIGYQDNNGQRNTAAVLSGGKNHWSYIAKASSKDAHCYQNKRDGFVANSGFNSSAAKVTVTHHRKWGYTQLIYSGYRMKLGIIEGERDSLGQFVTPQLSSGNIVLRTNTDSVYKLYDLQFPQQEIWHQKVVSNTRLFFGKRNLKMVYAYQENIRKEIGSAFAINAPDLLMRLRTGTYQVQLNGSTKKESNWSFGTSGMMQRSLNLGAEKLIADYALVDAGVYGLLFGEWKGVYWQTGLRYDHRWMHWNGIVKAFGGVSGSAGITYKIMKSHYLKLNISKGYRAPNAAELSSDGVHEGALRYEIGNANLKAESSFQTDLQVQLNWQHFSVSTSVFQNSIDNFIYITKLLASNGSDSLIGSMPVFEFRGQSALLRGFELQYDYHPHPLDWLHIGQSLSYVHAHFIGEKDRKKYYLPSIPPMRLNSNVEVELKTLGNYLSSVELGVNYMYVWQQQLVYSAYGTESSTASYGLLNAQISSDIKTKIFESLNVVVSGNNLLDVAYQDHLSRLKYAPMNVSNGYPGVWNMGRNISLKLVMGI